MAPLPTNTIYPGSLARFYMFQVMWYILWKKLKVFLFTKISLKTSNSSFTRSPSLKLNNFICCQSHTNMKVQTISKSTSKQIFSLKTIMIVEPASKYLMNTSYAGRWLWIWDDRSEHMESSHSLHDCQGALPTAAVNDFIILDGIKSSERKEHGVRRRRRKENQCGEEMICQQNKWRKSRKCFRWKGYPGSNWTMASQARKKESTMTWGPGDLKIPEYFHVPVEKEKMACKEEVELNSGGKIIFQTRVTLE